MKWVYQFLAAASLFLMVMGSLTTFATTPEESTAHRLEGSASQWRIEVLEEDFQIKKASEAELKHDLLGFFKQAGTPTYRKLNHYFECLCLVFIFSAVGWLREIYIGRGPRQAKAGTDAPAPDHTNA